MEVVQHYQADLRTCDPLICRRVGGVDATRAVGEGDVVVGAAESAFEPVDARARHVSGVSDVVVADDVDQARAPRRIGAEGLVDAGDGVGNAGVGGEYLAPVAGGAPIELAVADPLRAKEVAEDDGVGWVSEEREAPLDVGEIVVVAPEVDGFAERGEVVE